VFQLSRRIVIDTGARAEGRERKCSCNKDGAGVSVCWDPFLLGQTCYEQSLIGNRTKRHRAIPVVTDLISPVTSFNRSLDLIALPHRELRLTARVGAPAGRAE
jgi:hypothetical protein